MEREYRGKLLALHAADRISSPSIVRNDQESSARWGPIPKGQGEDSGMIGSSLWVFQFWGDTGPEDFG